MSARAPSAVADRITAATVTDPMLAARGSRWGSGLRRPRPTLCDTPSPCPTRTRDDIRNVAIVAHVDHGKTTLVDAMLRQTGAFRSNQALVDRVMDSMDLEREKGITILAKQTTVDYGDVRLNIVDTPGHADFGGEVERSLLMVDSVLLLVDAAEGPLPQTRYVLQKAMARHLPVVVALNKIDRSDARPAEVLDAIYELFIDLGATTPRSTSRSCTRTPRPGRRRPRSTTRARTCARCSTCWSMSRRRRPTRPTTRSSCSSRTCPRTTTSGGWPSGAIWNGTIRVGQRITVVRDEADDTAGAVEPGRVVTLTGTVTTLQTAHGIDRIDIAEAGPGDIVSVAGLPDVTIGDTLTDPGDPQPLPRLDVDAPTLRMTFGVNTSPLAGREGKYVTSRQIKARLDKEVLGNVSIEVRPAEATDAFEVRGRGELQLAVLIEQMRREGFELTASRPEVLLRTVDGETQEPYERVTIDIPPDYIGEVQGAHGRSQGPARTDDHRRRRARPDGVRAAGPRPDRLPRPAADRHARDGAAAPDRRGLRPVGRRRHPSHERRPRRRPRRDVATPTACSTSRSAPSCSSAPASRSTRG